MIEPNSTNWRADTPLTHSARASKLLRSEAAGVLPELVRTNRIGADRSLERECVRRIIRGYGSPVIRAYCRLRFEIMKLRFLEEIDQYLPREGSILDIGCGFGLFSLYFASVAPRRELFGVDLSARRIEAARRCAERMRLRNLHYTTGDAGTCPFPENLTSVYMLDLLHHLPSELVLPLLTRIGDVLSPGGVLLVKDVDTSPAYKRWFTLALDRLMVGFEPIRYWSAREMISMMEASGFRVFTHEMRDILPYPHRLYIGRKT